MTGASDMSSSKFAARLTAPLFHVPPRSRAPRLSMVPVTVEAELRDLGKDGHAAGPLLPCAGGQPIPTRVVDGRLWRPIEVAAASGRRSAMPLRDFHAWLSGHEGTVRHDKGDPARCLAATPLIARMRNHLGQVRAPGKWEPDQDGRVILDARARTAAAGARFLSEDIAILSGDPHVRMRGPLAFMDSKTGQRRILRHPGALTTYAGALNAIPFRIDLRDEQLEFERSLPPDAGAPFASSEWEDGLLAGVAMGGDDDLDLAIADGLRILVEQFELPQPDGGWPFPREAIDRVRTASALASSGLIEAQERADLFLLIDRTASSVMETSRYGAGLNSHRLSRHAAYARQVALPRLAGSTPLPSEDADALGAFAH